MESDTPIVQGDPVSSPAPSVPRRSRVLVPVALAAFVVGVLVAGWLALDGKLDFLMPGTREAPAVAAGQQAAADPALVLARRDAAQEQASMMVGSVETRLALLEDRLTRIDQQASAASGNAARAEGLLVAFAARRVIAKGQPLGYLENQLKLRFGGAQPDAVATVIAFSRDPVTIDQLSGGLDALAETLAARPESESGWARLRGELASLFIVRRAASRSVRAQGRVERARLLLASGRTGEAIADVSRMPGAEGATEWLEQARRYDGAQQALDVIETAAMLQPRLMQDAGGQQLGQASPLAPPADAARAVASGAPAAR